MIKSQSESNKVYWQAHRGGGAYEAPDNTMAANQYTWGLGGIPEADVRTTKDGIIVCLHDETPARTTNAPDSEKDRLISTFAFEETRKWDAGIKFHDNFRGEKIPSLEEVFKEMQGRPERMMYLDLKDVNLKQLGLLIDQYKVNHQVIFTHHIQDNCIQMKKIAEGVRTMLWVGGNVQQIKQKFHAAQESKFEGLDQVQIHLNSNEATEGWTYEIDQDFLQYANDITKEAAIDLEVLPFQFDVSSIQTLLNMGIRWFATDEPSRFLHCLQPSTS